MDNGKYLVDLELETIKYYADSVGNRANILLNDYIYVALIDKEGDAFYYRKHHFTSNNSIVQIKTDQIPAEAGIDPYLVLIDREMDDNIIEVVEAENSMVSAYSNSN